MRLKLVSALPCRRSAADVQHQTKRFSRSSSRPGAYHSRSSRFFTRSREPGVAVFTAPLQQAVAKLFPPLRSPQSLHITEVPGRQSLHQETVPRGPSRRRGMIFFPTPPHFVMKSLADAPVEQNEFLIDRDCGPHLCGLDALLNATEGGIGLRARGRIVHGLLRTCTRHRRPVA